MRVLTLALLGVLVAAAPALAARSSDRSAAPQRAKVAAASTQRTAPAAARPAPAVRSTAAHRPAGASAAGRSQPMRGRMLVSHSRNAAIALGAPSASPAACARRGAGKACRSARMSWTQGLTPAAGVQVAECPAGTMATLATGHADVTRCMPI